MITMTYENLDNKDLFSGLDKLCSTDLPMKTSYNVGRIQAKLKSEIGTFGQEWSALVKKKIEMVKEEGKPDMPKDMKQVVELRQEFHKIEFKIDWMPIPVSELEEVKLTPVEIEALAPIFSGLETLKNGG